jgi:hypothetical protein
MIDFWDLTFLAGEKTGHDVGNLGDRVFNEKRD